eukprot:4213682-Amphidinium_carterae.1
MGQSEKWLSAAVRQELGKFTLQCQWVVRATKIDSSSSLSPLFCRQSMHVVGSIYQPVDPNSAALPPVQ